MKHVSLLKDIKSGKTSPIYFIYGEEPYFIDLIIDFIAENVLSKDEKEFNFDVFYGKDTEVDHLLGICKSYPMMSPKRIVILKEAHQLKDIEKLESYFQKPIETTILVLGYRAKPDLRKKFLKSLTISSKNHVAFESTSMNETETIDWIARKFAQKKITIESKAAYALIELLGTDLDKLSNEIDKMCIALEPGSEIRLELVQSSVGLNREYNIFELQRAIAFNNKERIFKIANYAYNNPSEFSLPAVTAILYGYFYRIMLANQLLSTNKATIYNIAPMVRIFDKAELNAVTKNFTYPKLWRNMRLLLEYDLRSKGVNNDSTGHKGLLSELLFKLVL